ncbi:glycine cleavage system aminomethyltransferase GcvT [Helcobacillus massiliensis]|uniref:Aminomethyltransferase n=1 Tax=Helcobacillus massiliensis TaxID=521392 RepID=A0A839QSR7_9MICO|nr:MULTISPECIES: glycine cleavage system aminomethyltransferase GcvT [Helcobacillus]MBB3022698.1 aminomethyltransferase [Helcobacillus massiliensis]MCG7426369.1 glycine cleavage system aminomethyltransferase GcvT [Helcobacillus sp. ACRRO]MCT1558290.1 glycine cleavage system aminomethyltransferase GcvT [Helcobacillus massiliensis]MCT2035471.1 glycine cleavage system aminomethyltransferase GcvT [Helcobacillus massiliensis]MCT2332035.1 glycine cleavage system aminomethyltransferase GcvT [Helcobac
MSADELLRTPLQEVHQELGASFTDFAGWNMPVRYTSDKAEHAAVRDSAGQFDLSHMGEVFFTGPQAGEALDYALAGKLSSMQIGRAKYTLLLNDQGGIIDDLIVYRLSEDEFMTVPNAGNRLVDAEQLVKRAEGFDVKVEDQSEQTALVAVQGPKSADIVEEFAKSDEVEVDLDELAELKYYRILEGTYQGKRLLIARTGYTGEDGFELYVPNESAVDLWKAMETIGGEGILPCGLACRDSLRLEAGMPLYGNELSEDLFPAQAGLGRVVAFKSKDDFVGREALEGKDFSDMPVLVGMTAEGRRAARAGYSIKDESGTEIGHVSSGALSPTLGYPIALGYVDPKFAEPGTKLEIDVRGKTLPATVVNLPFYSREK